MLKRQITKTEHAALPDALKLYYVADAAGEQFTLQVSGFDDPAELRRAHDRTKQELREQKERADAAESKLNALGPDAKDKLKDIASLEKSWQDKLTNEVSARDSKLAERDRIIETLLVTNTAKDLANKLAGKNADILLPHIQTRLKIEYVEGHDPIVRVLDKHGKPSAMNVPDLEKDFRADDRYKPVIVQSQGSGSGAAGHSGGGAGSGGAGTGGGKKFSELTEQERVQFYKEDPAGFQKASNEHVQSVRNGEVAKPISWIPANV